MNEMSYSNDIGTLIEGLTEMKNGLEPSQWPIARELSIAITALEDAQMRVNRAGALISHGNIAAGNLL